MIQDLAIRKGLFLQAAAVQPIGSDNENEKCTYVSLLGIERSKEIVSELTEKAKNALKCFDGDAESLVDFADKMEKRKN